MSDRNRARGGNSGSRQRNSGTWQVERQQGRREAFRHHVDLSEFLDAMAEVRSESADDLPDAGEHALKVLDRFLATLANALGANNDRMGMGESIGWLNGIGGPPREIAQQAERFRETRNALAHNPDITLRPEAATRIINSIENLIRSAAQAAGDLTRSAVITVKQDEPLEQARDRMLQHRYSQLVVVDHRGGALDLLTDRDIVIWEAQADGLDDADDERARTVGDATRQRGYLAAAFLPRDALLDDAISALQDERVVAAILTEQGRTGQKPLGILTRSDLLRARA